MRIAGILTVLFWLSMLCVNAQKNDTLNTQDLMGELSAGQPDTTQLLPNHFLITQRIFWGRKGLMRNFTYFKLSPAERDKELKIRRDMLVAHQALGLATLGGMVAQGIVGVKLYNGDTRLRGTHEALAGFVNFGYFTTASLALFAPPKMLDERKGYSSIKLHRALAVVHLSGMIATNVLAGMLESHPNLKAWHEAAAFTAFGAYAAAVISIKF